MPIMFPPWRPDLYGLNMPIAAEALNVIACVKSYEPWPGFVAFSEALATTCRGAFLARNTAGAAVLFAGTGTKLYKFAGPADAWTDVSRLVGGNYAVAADDFWSFDQFGDYLVACHINDVPQYIAITGGSNFASVASLGDTPPTASFVRTIGDQVFLGGISGALNRLQWSARNNLGGWTVGSGDSDYQDFPDGGDVSNLTSLETGLVFQRNTIRRIVPVVDRAIYNFFRLEETRGTVGKHAMAVIGRLAFYLSQDGFYASDGVGGSRPIGEDHINDWFLATVHQRRVSTVVAIADPTHQRVYWLFPSNTNETNYLDHMLCYDVSVGQWTHADLAAADMELSFAIRSVTPGITLDDLDDLGYSLDDLPFSLDSRAFKEGAPLLVGFNSDNKLAAMSGPALAARLETADFQLIQARRAFVRGVYPLSDAATVTATVATKESPAAAPSYGSASSINTQGLCPVRASGRYHRVRVDIPAGEAWTHTQGVDLDFVQDGQR